MKRALQLGRLRMQARADGSSSSRFDGVPPLSPLQVCQNVRRYANVMHLMFVLAAPEPFAQQSFVPGHNMTSSQASFGVFFTNPYCQT